MSVRPKPAGGYEVQFRLPGGRQRGRTFETEAQAKRWEAIGKHAGWEHALQQLESPQAAVAPTVESWAHHHVDHLTSVNEDTRRDYHHGITAWPAYVADMPLPALNRDAVARWINELRAAGVAPKTIANRHSLLSGCLKGAVEAGHLIANVAYGIALPKGASQAGTYISPADIRAILDELDPWYHPLVHVLVSTGLRYGEATGLHWSDLTLDGSNPHLRVARTWKQAPGGVALGVPKTTRSVGPVYIDAGLVAILREHLDVETSRGRGRGGPCECRLIPGTARPAGSLVFTTRRGKKVAERFRDDFWTPAVARAVPDLHPPPTPHDCRHAMATYLLEVGVPAPIVQARVRHERIDTTVRVYGHMQQAAIRAAADAAGGMRAGGSVTPQKPATG